MSNHTSSATRALPDRPSLRHLRDQAKDLLKSGGAVTLADAQFQIARSYGFTSWPKLKFHLDSLAESGKLKEAIDRNDLRLVQSMMKRNPELHQAPLGYGNDGPLTWVAECRVPFVAPNRTRLAMAKWMIENGSDIHRGGDAPLMRAALNSQRIPMMELLVSLGADVNTAWHGHYPIIFAACEAINSRSLEWLLNHGADPNCGGPDAWRERGVPYPGTALDYVLITYARDPEKLSACIDILLAAHGKSKYENPAGFAVLRGHVDELRELLDADPKLVHQRFPELDFGTTAARGLTLQGCTLLHVAAEFQRLDAATVLLERGADANAKATVDEAGVGGQTPIFHAATQYNDAGLPLVRLLVERGADLTIRAKLPGSCEEPGATVECTPLGYALLFPGDQGLTSVYLRERGGDE
ncbi:MAG: ankyrin repeat domain-containing protein [Pyrinomonadaceae bacterium]